MDSHTLGAGSGLFETILSLPQAKTHASCDDSEVVPVYEPDVVLDPFLRLLCHVAVAPCKTYDDLERLLMVAEKWDAQGAITSLREELACSRFLASDPLRVYVLAKHFAWKEEANLAATQTLRLDLREPDHYSALAELPSHELLPLLKLHRTRRELFKTLLDSSARFTVGNRLASESFLVVEHHLFDSVPTPSESRVCPSCGKTQLDNSPWQALKAVLVDEINRRPLGDTLESILGEKSERPEAKACWEARCRDKWCGGLNYDKSATVRQIKNCLDLLPLTIQGRGV